MPYLQKLVSLQTSHFSWGALETLLYNWRKRWILVVVPLWTSSREVAPHTAAACSGPSCTVGHHVMLCGQCLWAPIVPQRQEALWWELQPERAEGMHNGYEQWWERSTPLPLPLASRGWSCSRCIPDVILNPEKARFLCFSSFICLLIFGCHIGTLGMASFLQPNPRSCWVKIM